MIRKFTTYITTIIIISAIILNCSSNSEQQSQEPQQANQPDSIYVTQVLDGDTFILSNNKIVRIIMIDTPEREEPLYYEATSCLSDLILNRAVELKHSSRGQDRYGRTLAEVMIDTINVGKRVLYNGYAVMYVYPDNRHLIDRYLPAQISAIDRNVGIWALPGPVPEQFYINSKGSFRFHRPLCGHIKNSKPANMIRYINREDALKNGLSPCRSCKP